MGPVEYPKDMEATSGDEQYRNIEDQPLLPSSTIDSASPTKPRFSVAHIIVAFLLGVLVQFLVAHYVPGSFKQPFTSPGAVRSPETFNGEIQLVPPYVGSTEVDHYPPASPTNAFPSLFPSNVGFRGPTPTGAEPALLATAPVYPVHSGAPGLLAPASLTSGKSGHRFDLFKHWGNLSPWYSNKKGVFGVDSGPEPPEGCRVTGLHLLHRHGARYPTGSSSYAGPSSFASKLHNAGGNWSAEGGLTFLNEWTYKLGEEVLTPFGRHQLFDLGVSTRIKYGFLLKNFTESNTLPVFRTESQDRMLASAQNFAIGFFGYPFDGMYEQSITIEAFGQNNTLAPYETCTNANDASKGGRGTLYLEKWADKYLKDAQTRLNAQLKGLELTIADVYSMQQMCAYETVAIGYSKFCELFTEEEWKGFDYSLDLYFWYSSSFGSPVARVLGIGYVQELVARLTQTPIQTHNSTTNGTLDDNEATFPLDGRSLYVDATHEVVILNILTTLNLSTLAKSGPLPADRIPKERSYITSQLAPFASNVQFQLLSCSSKSSPQIRVIVNDGVVPLSPIKGCADDAKYGMCAVDGFVGGLKEIIRETDWNWGCFGNWTVPAGDEWHTVDGTPPPKPA